MSDQQSEVSTRDNELPDIGNLERMVGDLLAEAKSSGATAAEAAVSMDIGLGVTVRKGDVETLEFHRDRGLGVTVYFGQRKGSASTSDFRAEAIRETVQAACDIARYTSEDTCSGLAPAERMATDIPELDLYHPWGVTADQAIEIAKACEHAGLETDPRITNSEGATVNSHQGLRVYGNSHGFMGGYPSTRHSISCSLIGEQGGHMQRDYWYSVSRLAEELEAGESIGRMAAERTVRRLDARRLGTRQVPVIFAAEVATGLFRSFTGAIRGSNLYRNSSFLLDHLGKPVFPEFMHIYEQPHLPRALGSAPFDNEGVATSPRDLITDGVLQGYVLDSYSARKLDMETTGNAGGVHNLSVDTSDKDIHALVQEMDTGLLITELMGQGVNIVTGDYSRGASGFWVENGQIQYPVEEITVAGNLKQMFKHIVAIGNDIETRGNIRTGSVMIESMTVAGE